MTFKFMENGFTQSSKIVLIIASILFGLSILATLTFGTIIGFFGLADTIPAWTAMTPIALFISLLVLAIVVNIFIIAYDAVINKNYNEYVELIKIVPRNQQKQSEELHNYIFNKNSL